MRICIVGCGAVGSLFAANLATLDDVEVWAFDLSQPHVDAISERGLRLCGAARCTARLQRHERPRGAAAVRFRHRRHQGDARRVRDRGDRARLRRGRRGLGHERRRQRGGARRPRPARDPRHDLPGGQAARARARAMGRQGRHDVRALRAAARAMAEVERLAEACTRGGMPAHAVPTGGPRSGARSSSTRPRTRSARSPA